MDFLIIAYDRGDGGKRRNELRGAHLDFVKDKQHLYKYGGPILDDNGTMIGSIMIITLPDRAALDAHLAQDPYFRAGANLFESVTIRRTKHVVPEPEPGRLAAEIEKQRAKA